MRVEERHEFLGQYIKSAGNGEFGIAAFQRPFVWDKIDIEKFLQSVMDGIPIGGFLLWTLDKDQDAEVLSKGRIGPVVHDAASRTMILDGQNRLASIIWAARAAEAPDNPVYPYSEKEREVFFSGETLVADFDEKRMHFVPDAAAYSATRYPLGEILAAQIMRRVRPTDVYQRMTAAGVPDEHFNWFFDDIPHAFLSKKTVVTEILDATAEEVFDIFMRICKTGQPMTDHDFEAARAWMIPGKPFQP
jgi:hypothetical protein